MIKKHLLVITALFLSITVFSQKNEVKAADKAFKKGDFAAVLSALSGAESSIANADSKTKVKFYYLKGMALYANGTTPQNGGKAVEALNMLMDLEKQSKSVKYSKEASKTIQNIVIDINNTAAGDYDTAIKSNNVEGFKKASEGFYRVYQLSPKDTSALYSAAVASYYAKDFENSSKHFKGLLDVGYTGVSKTFKAENMDGTPRYFNSKKDMDASVRLGIVKNGKEETTPSRQKDIYKYLALGNASLGNNEVALEMIKKAREFDAEDYSLILDEANVHYKLGDNQKYTEKIEEAIAIKPNDPVLHFNVGTLNMDVDTDKAKKHLLKAVELDPNFASAYGNLGNLILKGLEAVEKELDANAMNFAKYDKIKAEKWVPILKESLPYLEKSYELQPTESLKTQLNSLYENLDMEKRAE